MSEEILSKRTIAVLLVLSMLLSVFGTLAVLNYLEGYSPPVLEVPAQMQEGDGQRAGQLTLEIMPRKSVQEATGYVALDIREGQP